MNNCGHHLPHHCCLSSLTIDGRESAAALLLLADVRVGGGAVDRQWGGAMHGSTSIADVLSRYCTLTYC